MILVVIRLGGRGKTVMIGRVKHIVSNSSNWAIEMERWELDSFQYNSIMHYTQYTSALMSRCFFLSFIPSLTSLFFIHSFIPFFLPWGGVGDDEELGACQILISLSFLLLPLLPLLVLLPWCDTQQVEIILIFISSLLYTFCCSLLPPPSLPLLYTYIYLCIYTFSWALQSPYEYKERTIRLRKQ